jgi:hypothetical protein
VTATPAAEHRVLTDDQLLDRFVVHHDEAAFHDLVARHGPKVFHLCRRILLHDGHDAKDAFLVLLRKVASLQPPVLLGHCLCGVAYRIASYQGPYRATAAA